MTLRASSAAAEEEGSSEDTMHIAIHKGMYRLNTTNYTANTSVEFEFSWGRLYTPCIAVIIL